MAWFICELGWPQNNTLVRAAARLSAPRLSVNIFACVYVCVCVVYMYLYILVFVRQREYNSLQIKQETHNYLSLCGPSNGNDSSRHYSASPWNSPLCSDLAQRHQHTQKGTNITKQMSVNRFRHKDRHWNRVAPTKSARNFFASRLFAVFSLLGSVFDFFIAEILAWGTSDSLEGTARGSQRGRATYFVLNLLVHTNALLTVFRFRFHFVFSSSSFRHHCCCSLLLGLKFG